MAVEIIGDPVDVKKYRKFLDEQGVYTKRFQNAFAKQGMVRQDLPEGFRIFNGAIKDVYGRKGTARTKRLDEDRKLYIAGIANANIEDRMDERLDPAGIDIENFMKNRVLLADHMYATFATIGRVIDLKAEADGVHFEAYVGDPEKASLTQQQKDVRSLVAQRLLQTVSVGFIPHKIQAPVFDSEGKLEEGPVILQWELLELSVVAVPANPGAVFDIKHSTEKKKSVMVNGANFKDIESNNLSIEDEKIMEEKLVELVEEMKRIGTLLGSMNDSMKNLLEKNEEIRSVLDNVELGAREEEDEEEMDEEENEMEEDEEEEDEKGEDEEDEEEEEEEDNKKELSELKELIEKQNEKIEMLSGAMLNVLKK